MHFARGLMRRTEPGKHYGQITAKALAILTALLWDFHNATDGRCFPSYAKIAEKADCAVSTVAEGIKALEGAGLMTWDNRIKRRVLSNRLEDNSNKLGRREERDSASASLS
jgi:Helix-turn-helix domain